MKLSVIPYLFCTTVILLQANPVLAQPATGKIIKGQVKTNAHPYKMETGNAYLIRVETNGFTPAVDLVDEQGSLANRFGTGKVAELLFLPKKSAEYQILVTPSNYSRLGKGENTYTLTVNVAQFKLAKTFKHGLDQSNHAVKMKKGHVYFVTLRSQIFKPELRVLVNGEQIHAKVGKKVGDAYVISWTHQPVKTVDAKLLITSSPYDPIRKDAKYTLNVEDRKPMLSVQAKLTMKDKEYLPKAGCHFKPYAVKLKAGQRYQISMSSDFDTFLVLEDAKGKIVGQDDDGGGGLNSRLIFTPKANGEYRIIATSFARALTGEFSLSVVEVPDAEE